MSYLYLLVDGSGDGFKIGVSIDPSQRMASLPESFDIDRSFQIKCGDKNSYRVEKMLHLLFKKYRLDKQRADGYTEWFSMECFDAVNEFIQNQRELLEWENYEPIKIKPMPLNTSLNVQSKTDRKMIREEKKKADFLECQRQNYQVIEDLSDWINLIKQQNILVGKFDFDYYGHVHTHLAVLSFEGIRSTFPDKLFSYYLLRNSNVCGNFNVINSYMGSDALKYAFSTFCDLNDWIDSSTDDIQPILEIIGSIDYIKEPQLSEVLSDYKRIIRTPLF